MVYLNLALYYKEYHNANLPVFQGIFVPGYAASGLIKACKMHVLKRYAFAGHLFFAIYGIYCIKIVL